MDTASEAINRHFAVVYLLLAILGACGCHFKNEDLECRMCPVGRLDVTCYEFSKPEVEEDTIIDRSKERRSEELPAPVVEQDVR
jgi:hypothetical protein